MDMQPFLIAMRHAQTGEIEYLHLEAYLTYNQMKDKLRKRVGTRAGDLWDWVGVKRGDRVLYRGKRFEEVDVRRASEGAQESLV
jgi:acyl-CoA synthetase (AMP-forming)/AMP-acid ligase II